jgi:hypothetical protein
VQVTWRGALLPPVNAQDDEKNIIGDKVYPAYWSAAQGAERGFYYVAAGWAEVGVTFPTPAVLVYNNEHHESACAPNCPRGSEVILPARTKVFLLRGQHSWQVQETISEYGFQKVQNQGNLFSRGGWKYLWETTLDAGTYMFGSSSGLYVFTSPDA